MKEGQLIFSGKPEFWNAIKLVYHLARKPELLLAVIPEYSKTSLPFNRKSRNLVFWCSGFLM
jgi:hypothetical protein